MNNVVIELRHLRTRQDKWKMFIVEDDRDIHEGALVDDRLGIRIATTDLLRELNLNEMRIVFVEEKRRIEHKTHLREQAKPEVIQKPHPLSIDYPDATDYAVITRKLKIHNTGNIKRWVWIIKVDGEVIYKSKNWQGTERGAFQSFLTFKRRQQFPILDLCSIRRFGIQTEE